MSNSGELINAGLDERCRRNSIRRKGNLLSECEPNVIVRVVPDDLRAVHRMAAQREVLLGQEAVTQQLWGGVVTLYKGLYTCRTNGV